MTSSLETANPAGHREIFLLAGEASGDVRGAELIRALRARDPAFHFSGMGGPHMRAEGMEVLVDLTDLAVVGIVEVLKHYGTFKRAMGGLLEEIQRRRPVAVIGVDYPGFNLRLLRKVHASDPGRAMPTPGAGAAIPGAIPLAQYISPQLWAWDEQRKWRMARYLDRVLCLFPFEPEIYAPTGLKAVFVGHPLARRAFFGEEARKRDLLAFFPGSREKELRRSAVSLDKLPHQRLFREQIGHGQMRHLDERASHPIGGPGHPINDTDGQTRHGRLQGRRSGTNHPGDR